MTSSYLVHTYLKKQYITNNTYSKQAINRINHPKTPQNKTKITQNRNIYPYKTGSKTPNKTSQKQQFKKKKTKKK